MSYHIPKNTSGIYAYIWHPLFNDLLFVVFHLVIGSSLLSMEKKKLRNK
jgi:hypothetical protein